MKALLPYSLILLLVCGASAKAQEPVDHAVIGRIKVEAVQNSQAMETLSYLTDVYGPRLSGSPNLKAASEWSRDRMASWGLSNAKLEPWGTFGRGWSIRRYSVSMTSPQFMQVSAWPKAWTPGTNGPVTGTPIVVDIKSKQDFEKYKGRLKGAIVMNGRTTNHAVHFAPEAKRISKEEIEKQASSLEPGQPSSYHAEEQQWKPFTAKADEITKFLHDEGVRVLLEPSGRDNGAIGVTTQSYTLGNPNLSFPALVVAREHYGRIMRLVDKKLPVTLSIDVDVEFHDEDLTGYNVVAEIPGTDPRLKDEVVMLGAHIDSWHAATGAADNAAGCVAMMEAMRILKAIGVSPRRTIRVALWSGEEQDYYGSRGYVKNHFGDPATLELKPEHAKLAAYFNLDNGAGRIRGIYLQGNERVRPIFEAWLAPFAYLGATTITTENTGGTDHMPFEGVGLPGFQFIQDPLDYSSLRHHTNLDFYEAVPEEDLKQASIIIASFAYHAAMRDEMLPREPMPKLPPPEKKDDAQQ